MAEGFSNVENDARDNGATDITEQDLRNLAKDIGHEWAQLATYLGIKQTEVAHIKSDHPGNTREQIFQMLMTWKRRTPGGDDQVEGLRTAFENVERKDLADRLTGGSGTRSHQSDVILCAEHVGNIKQYYCGTCQKMICKDCVRPYHGDLGHATHDVTEIAFKYRQNLRDLLEWADIERRATESALRDLQKKELDLNRRVKQAHEKVKEAVAKFVREAESRGKELTDDVDNQRASRSQSLQDERAELLAQLKRQSDHIEAAKLAAVIHPDSKFLLQYPATLQKITPTHYEVPAPKHAKQVHLSYPMFLESPSAGRCIDLGKVVIVNTWTQVCTIGRKGIGVGEFAGARGIAVADRFALTDRMNERVVFFDSPGINWKYINVTANDVLALSQKRWAIATPSVVRVYNRENGQPVSEFKTLRPAETPRAVNLMSLAVRRDGRILVGDTMKLLTEHGPDGSILRCVRVKTKPSFLAVMQDRRGGEQEELVVISEAAKSRVEIVQITDGTDEATTVGEIHPILGGKPAQDCRGVCADDSGVYVAATTATFNQGHVHHYDARGRFIACVAKNLYNPYGIALAAGGRRLAVADCQSVKLFEKA